MDTLSALLARIETCFGFQICVHDVSGITHAHEQLSLEGRHTYHDCSYCATLKQNPKCQNRCLQQKRLALREARRKPEGYLGVCYLGVCEAVRTVSLAGRPVAVVFVGGVVKELGAQARERAIRNSALLGGSMDVGTLFDAFAQQAQTSRDTLCFCADLIVDRMVRVAEQARLQDALAVPDDTALELPTPIPRVQSSFVRHTLLPYLAAHYRYELSLKLLSDMFFMNPYALCRMFKRETGDTIHAYIARCRICDACTQLRNTEKSVAQIAQEVGIADANYFTRLFTKQMGQTPTAYRR